MLLGTWEYRIDASGHVALPASYRPALRDGVVITRGLDSCLQGFSLVAWLRLAQQISALPLGVAEARSLRRLLFGGACSLRLDGRGRVMLSPLLREYAGLGDAAIVTGLDAYFEIWSPARWRNEAQRFQQLAPGQFEGPLRASAAGAGRSPSWQD